MDVRLINANSLHKVISEWPEPVMYKDWVQSEEDVQWIEFTSDNINNSIKLYQ